MIGAVIVAAVRYFYRQAVGVIKGTHKMIGRCFGSRVRTAGVIGGIFIKETCFAQRTIHFIGRDVVKDFVIVILFPAFLGCQQQGRRSHYIGSYKSQRICNRPVHMTLCGAMQHSRKLMFGKKMLHQVHISNVSFYKSIIRRSLYIS